MRWLSSWSLHEDARRTSQNSPHALRARVQLTKRGSSTSPATLHVKRNLANPHLATSPTRRPLYEPTAGRLTTRPASCAARLRCFAAIASPAAAERTTEPVFRITWRITWLPSVTSLRVPIARHLSSSSRCAVASVESTVPLTGHSLQCFDVMNLITSRYRGPCGTATSPILRRRG